MRKILIIAAIVCGALAAGAATGQTVTTGDSVTGRCDYSAPIDDPAGYYRICIDATTGTLKLDGTKSPPRNTLKIELDGQVYDVPASAAIVGSDAVVSNNNALKLAVGAAGKRLVRLGFWAAGDGGIATYNWSADNCTAADNGAQVQPRTTGCWIADLAAGPITPQLFGAIANDTNDDAPAIQAAVTAAKGAKIYFPRGTYRICSEITSNAPVWIAGDASGAGPGHITPGTKISLCSANQNGFKITTQIGSRFERLWITSEVQQNAGYAAIWLVGPTSNHVSQQIFESVALGSASYEGPLTLYDGIKIVVPNYPDFDKVYCQGWANSCINLVTKAPYEGSGGFIHHSYFFGAPRIAAQGPAIYSEVGYTAIRNNLILGGSNTVHFCIKNHPAGAIDISHNTIENSKIRGILVESCDGQTSSMLSINNNEFSNYEFSDSMAAHIDLAEYTPGGPNVKWLKTVNISNNIFRSNLPASSKYIFFRAGGNAIVSGNVIEELGPNNPMAIQITGLANNNSLSPRILVRDNMITGTTNRLVGNSTTPPIFVDLSGDFAIGTLPAYPASGSTVMTSDGTPGSNPCTGGGPGAMAMFQADRWKCF